MLSKEDVFKICSKEMTEKLSIDNKKITDILKYVRYRLRYGERMFEAEVEIYMRDWTLTENNKTPLGMRYFIRNECDKIYEPEWLQNIKDYVEEEIKNTETPTSLVRKMIIDTIKRMSNKIIKEGYNNTMLRTSEFHRYLNNTMGQNEFALMIARNDIFTETLIQQIEQQPNTEEIEQ